MSTDANRSAAFYCPVHQIRFHATAAEVIECDQASHAIGYGFPAGSLWTYCCACATFSPHGIASLPSKLTECPVCERPIGKRCLCHSCQVVTVESVALIHRKAHSIDDHGVKPFCPGCGTPPAERVVQHDCPELGISFLTARPSCLFCELQILSSIAPRQNEASGILCNSCGAELVPPLRFCKKCGKAQSQTEPVELDDELSVQDGLSESIKESNESEDEPASQAEPPYISPWDDSPPPTPPPKARTPWLLGGAAALLLVGLLIAVAVTNTNRTPPPVQPAIPAAPPGMVYVAGGDFMVGNNAGDEYERPAHKVSVAPFFIDVAEVTCEEYLEFLTATARRRPRNWTMQTCQNAGRQPVTGVDWNDAKNYAGWAKKRLPTEQEWEFAARGVLGSLYPWGNEWKSGAANAGDSSAQQMMDVGSYRSGSTPAGVMDLIGNAVEWTSSDVVAYPGGSLSSPIPPDVKVVRGGSWRDRKEEATATYRGFLHTTNAKDYSVTGFRCVKDVGPSPVQSPKP